jgi:hypothetical protein
MSFGSSNLFIKAVPPVVDGLATNESAPGWRNPYD